MEQQTCRCLRWPNHYFALMQVRRLFLFLPPSASIFFSFACRELQLAFQVRGDTENHVLITIHGRSGFDRRPCRHTLLQLLPPPIVHVLGFQAVARSGNQV